MFTSPKPDGNGKHGAAAAAASRCREAAYLVLAGAEEGKSCLWAANTLPWETCPGLTSQLVN